MRFPYGLILLAFIQSPAAAQSPAPVLAALQRSFPAEHAALSGQLRGHSAAAQSRLVSEAMHRFAVAHQAAIVAAPGGRLIGLEVRHGAMLRALQRRDVALCARLGDRGFFGRAARAAAPAPNLDDYAVALIEAAAAGRGRPPPAAAEREDYSAWMAAVGRREPDVPVQTLLLDREARARASDDHLCAGAAAMHEAIGDLPPEQGARVAATLIRSLITVE